MNRSKNKKSSKRENTYSVGRFFDDLTSKRWQRKDFILWPPDVFALCAGVFSKTGCYRHLFDDWQPTPEMILLIKPEKVHCAKAAATQWQEDLSAVSSEWAKIAKVRSSKSKSSFPSIPKLTDNGIHPLEHLVVWWEQVLSDAPNVSFDTLRSSLQGPRFDTTGKHFTKEFTLIHALQHLMSAADAACLGAGFVGERVRDKDGSPSLALTCSINLSTHTDGLCAHTLCSELIDSSRLAVLPKCRTSQVGATFRSCTHNLVLHWVNEIVPRWRLLPNKQVNKESGRPINLLILPWPEQGKISSSNFKRKNVTSSPVHMHESFGFFEYTPPEVDANYRARFIKAIDNAKKLVGSDGQIDGVIMPEMAIRSSDFTILKDILRTQDISFFICGVGQSTQDSHDMGENKAMLWTKFGDSEIAQNKHHRWKLDQSQVRRLGLVNALDAKRSWWEGHSLKSREHNFCVFDDSGLVLTVLICEDLARQDPVSELIRNVGPSLVVSLLLDGPQVAERWPARYATVLADDPGSSVLTVTSIGMISLASEYRNKPNRSVCLWKQRGAENCSLVLDEKAVGLVLCLSVDQSTEYCADGRDDKGGTQHVSYVECKQVYIEDTH